LTGKHPDHWIPYAGPAAWFTLWFPPSWEQDESDGVLSLTVPGGGGLLTVRSFWLDAPAHVNLEEIINLGQLFPRRRNVRPLKGPDVSGACVAFEGQVDLSGDVRWWRRLWVKGTWRKWRVWCLQHESVCLLALFLQMEEYDPEAETLASMVVNTVQFAAKPADPPNRFATRVLELARRKFPLLNSELADDFQMRLGDSNINLFNFYRSYLSAPDQFEAILLPALATVVQMQGWGKAQMEPALDDVRERIMPMLYPEAVWQERFPNFVGSAWVARLVVLYVVDESQAYWYIRDELLQIWGLTTDELHDLALANLEEYFKQTPMEFTLAGESAGPQLLLPMRPDAYNTSRFLSTAFQEKLRELLGQEFCVGIPSRDFFVAVSLDSPEAVEQVRHKVSEDFHQMDHPLSDRMLLVTYDGISEYCVD
jgi:hypothetical protein